MKKYIVTVDVTISGDIEIEAQNEKVAAKIVQYMYFTANGLRNCHEVNKDIFKVKEIK